MAQLPCGSTFPAAALVSSRQMPAPLGVGALGCCSVEVTADFCCCGARRLESQRQHHAARICRTGVGWSAPGIVGVGCTLSVALSPKLRTSSAPGRFLSWRSPINYIQAKAWYLLVCLSSLFRSRCRGQLSAGRAKRTTRTTTIESPEKFGQAWISREKVFDIRD